MAIVGPIAPQSNPPINPQYFQPQRFQISNITLGQTTTVTTIEDMDYVVGQEVRLIIPPQFGSRQLNEQKGFVLSISSATQVVISINSAQNVDAFYNNIATITGATKANPCVLTTDSKFTIGDRVLIEDVSGMTQLNGNVYSLEAVSKTTITISVNSTAFSTYTSGGTATLQASFPQILAVGDISSGQINSSGRISNLTYIPGSFINISPN